jgi:hypothetical protein
MNRIRRLRRSVACMPRRAGGLAAFAAATAAWRPGPPFAPGWKLPSGWNNYQQLPPGWRKHPPLPLGHVAGPVYKVPAQIPAHTTVTGGMPGWQITLITATAVLLAAALVLAACWMRSGRSHLRGTAQPERPKPARAESAPGNARETPGSIRQSHGA